MIVVDNAADKETDRVVRSSLLPCRYLPQAVNLGSGGGTAIGFKAALDNPAVTHCWQIDDDAVVEPDTVSRLLAGLEATGAAAAVPLLENEAGEVSWFPGLHDPRKWQVILRRGLKPADYLRECGDEPVSFTWSPWCVFLVTRIAIKTVGLPRTDFGFMAEDIEFTLRLTARFPAVLVPSARSLHLPPKKKDGVEGHYTECLNLQNMSFLTVRLAHGRRALRHLPGAYWRFFRRQGWSMRTLQDATRAGWRGAVAGRPGGAPGYDGFRMAWAKIREQ